MKENYNTSRSERFSYCIYFAGQNILWAYAGLVSTYLLDIGLDAKVASAILLGPKIWDAVNDTLFGLIVDKTRFKNKQKFIPWIKIGTALIGVVTILMFAIPKSLSNPSMKIAWFLVAYILFDAAYTMLDAPVYALPTAMTTNIQERTDLISSNRFGGILGGAIGTILIPIIRPKTGWLLGAIIFCAFGTAFMLPLLFTGKERNAEKIENEKEYTIGEMFSYVKTNKYLIITLLLYFIIGVCSIETTLSLVMARNCFGDEAKASLLTLFGGLPILFISLLVPVLSKKIDKVVLLTIALVTGFVGALACYFVGYHNYGLYIAFSAIKSFGAGFFMVISYMMIADSVEYGTYKSGVRMPGISFALQTFTSKLKNAIVGSVALLALGMFGYDSTIAETAIQAQPVIDGIWKVYNLMPAAGYIVSALLLILFYKMRDKEVEAMARYNNGEITREEAEKQLGNRL
ncbi:MAG: MFS transporter [Erysipelotrichaceae bacterium]|nr:MFS transporter [Erysipelotrichaceae bacterium]